MAGSVNKVIIVGNLGKDPEIRALQDGKEVANLTVATSESWSDRASGEKRERTEWHRVVIFAPGLVTIAKQYLRKGAKVYLEGSLQTRKWQDQSGQERYTTEVVLQQYGGTLVLLGRGGGGAEGAEESEGGGDSGGFPEKSVLQDRAPERVSLQPKKRFASPVDEFHVDEFHDDIPF